MANDGSSIDWRPSKLMLLRLWSAQAGEAGEQLRGKLQLVVSGEAHYFEGGEALVELLLALLRRPEASISLPDRPGASLPPVWPVGAARRRCVMLRHCVRICSRSLAMKHHVRLSVPCAALALMAGLTVGCGSLAPQAQQSAPGFEVEVTAGGLKVPAEVPSGIVTVTYKNSSDAPASPAIGWLNDGRTMAEFEQAINGEDFPAILEMANTPGGAQLDPGESEQQTYQVPEGEIAAVNFPEQAPPQLATSVAKESTGAAAPNAELTAELKEFSFTLPETIPAGKHLWEIRNTGQQWHHMIVLKPKAGTAIEAIVEMASSEEEPQGEPPYEEVAYFGDISGGTTAWVTLDIPAGDYYAVCFLPDSSSEQMTAHISHGMLQPLKVE